MTWPTLLDTVVRAVEPITALSIVYGGASPSSRLFLGGANASLIPRRSGPYPLGLAIGSRCN